MKASEDKQKKKPGILLDTHRKTVESSRGMSPAILLGSSFALAMGGLAWLGHRYDEKHGTEPWGVLLGVLLGFVYGAYEVWKVTAASTAEPSASSKGESEASPRPPEGE